MKISIAAITIITTVLTGCMSGMPNHIKQQQSSFDGTTQYVMEPGFIYESADFASWGSFKLGLSWRSKQPDQVIITAQIPNSITSISSNKGLQFNINGKITTLNSQEIFTNFDSTRVQNVRYNSSDKQFITTKELINTLIAANSVKVKLITDQGFLEGDLLADKPSAAIRGFKEFMQKIRDKS